MKVIGVGGLAGLGPNLLNKSSLSAINHKSEYLSDIGDAISNRVSIKKKL